MYLFKVFLSLIKMFFAKMIYGRKLNFNFIQLLSLDTKIKILNNGQININRGLHTRANVVLLCDNGAITIGKNIFLNNGCFITSLDKIIIGDNCSFGPNVMVFDHDHNYKRKNKTEPEFIKSPIIIGNNVWVGANVVILKGSIIGDNCVIGAGTVIKGSIPSNSVVYSKNDLILKEIDE